MTKVRNMEKTLNTIIKLPQLQKDYYQNFIQRAKDLLVQLDDKEFRITVVGEFSAGKSTFLNALIGKDILPHSVNETTATVTYIKNVKANDPLCNKVKIDFFGDKQPIVINMPEDAKGLTEYVTTMAQQLNVVQEVAAVTLHVDFPYTDEPIVFVDTPGLNGVAEGHYERTRYEIQRAHTSIYLLHTRGLSQSNVQMYELLKQYQSSFLFVVNAVDTLKQDEGETASLKIKEVKGQLAQIGVMNNPTILGVSSLFALTAKDKSITKLFEADVTPMTDERRQMLLDKSNFPLVEKEIWQRLTTSDKEQVKRGNIEHKFKALIADIVTEFEEQVAIHNVTINEQQLQEINTRLDLATQLKEDNFKNLRNFTVAKKADVRLMLLDELKKETKQAYDTIEQDVQVEIQRYIKQPEQPTVLLKALHSNVKQKMERVESGLSQRYTEVLGTFLSDIYESAVLRIEKHYPKITIAKQKVNFAVALDKANLDNVALIEKIEKKQRELTHTFSEQESAVATLQRQSRELNELQQDVNTLDRQRNGLSADRQRAIRNLGTRPSVQTREESYEVKKGAIRGFFSSVFGGSSYETRYRTVRDDSRQKEWDRREQQLREEYNRKEANLRSSITGMQQRLNRAQDQKLTNESMVRRMEKKLADLSSDLKFLQKEKQEIYDKNKRLYYEKQRKEILQAVEDYMLRDLPQFYRKEFDAILAKEIVKIDNAIKKHYEQSYKEYMTKLERLRKQVLQEAVPAERQQAEKELVAIQKALL